MGQVLKKFFFRASSKPETSLASGRKNKVVKQKPFKLHLKFPDTAKNDTCPKCGVNNEKYKKMRLHGKIVHKCIGCGFKDYHLSPQANSAGHTQQIGNPTSKMDSDIQIEPTNKQVEDLIRILQNGEEHSKAQATSDLCEHPCDATVKALENALKDSCSEVRHRAAESLRVIAARKTWKVNVAPILEALKNEPKEDGVEYGLQLQLKLMGAGAAAERVMEQKRKADIKNQGGSKADTLEKMQQQAKKLESTGTSDDTTFKHFFADLRNVDPDIRAEASRLLATSPNALSKLIKIYQEFIENDPRKSVLGGRVLGRKLDGGKEDMINAQTSMMMFGIQVAFTPCVCGRCGKLNVGIPVPENGLYIGFYGQSDNKHGAYALPVLCDYCGKEFYIAWDKDPR